ncbi:hypothetical protein [Accumulibacter sp.]|uniref:hypothetical protein n=1 Tax=Accumulibacter sp. TaxID=2053492 RepID=UPI00262C93D3|nr:hypothetical protein [Accumulibacter sp.]
MVIGIARPDSLSFRLFGDRWPSLQALRHTMLFTRRTLCAMVEKAGLRVVKWLPWGAFFAGAAFNLSKKSGLYTYVGRLADTWRVEDVEINRGGCLPAFHQRWHAQFAGHGEAD